MPHSMLIEASLAAAADVAEAQAAAESLVSVMKRIHGGNWSMTINHLRRVVLVWQTDELPAQEEPKCAGGRGARRR